MELFDHIRRERREGGVSHPRAGAPPPRTPPHGAASIAVLATRGTNAWPRVLVHKVECRCARRYRPPGRAHLRPLALNLEHAENALMNENSVVAKRQIRKALRTLAQDLSAKEQLDPETRRAWKTIPEHLHHLVSGATDPDFPPSLTMSLHTHRLYRHTLDLLVRERRRRYLSDAKSDRELEKHFWSFCCEIVLDDSVRTPAAQKSKIDAFVDAIDIPCVDYEALVQITGIAIPHRIALGEVELIRGSPTLLKEWKVWSNPLRPQWRGHTVARMKLSGGTLQAAQRKARERTSMLCDELRIARSSSLYVHVDDSDLAFGTGWSVVRGNGSRIYRLGRLVKKPVPWHADSFRAALDYLAPLYDLRATTRSSVQERVELAIRWFGMARSVGTPWALKIIALFSGLEAILIRGGKRTNERCRLGDSCCVALNRYRRAL